MSEPRTPTLCIPIESRTSIEAKALRILLERRLTILHCKGNRIFAEVRGTDRLHHCGYGNTERSAVATPVWWCDCEVRGDRCSHLAALQHVTIRPEDDNA